MIDYPIHFDQPIAEVPDWSIGLQPKREYLAMNALDIYLKIPRDNWNVFNRILYGKD